MIAIPNMEKPKDCDGIGINIHFTDGHIELHILDECELIEVRDDYFKYYMECERLNDSRDLLEHRGCMDCDVKLKCLYAFTPEAEECNHYSNAIQHIKNVGERRE